MIQFFVKFFILYFRWIIVISRVKLQTNKIRSELKVWCIFRYFYQFSRFGQLIQIEEDILIKVILLFHLLFDKINIVFSLIKQFYYVYQYEILLLKPFVK